ncbi:MAG: iron ABC transporter permease [Actinobacteria bacterium]|nr:iron ABC transporter permease [Actinomycetota bacterium]
MTVTDRLGRVALIGLPVAFLAAFFLWPVVSILWRGLAPDGNVDLFAIGAVAGDASLRSVAWFTFWQAAVSTLVTLALGLPGAYVLSRYRFHGRALLRALVTVPFVMPTVVVGAAFGALGVTRSITAILLAHAFFNYAVVTRTVGSLWAQLDDREQQAARVLGAGRARVFWSVTLPALRPAIGAAAAIVFLFCFTSFGVILILGGPGSSTIETEIYRQTAQQLDLQTAAVLSLLQLVAVLAVIGVSNRARRRQSAAASLRGGGEHTLPVRGRRRLVLAANLAVMGTLLGLPLAELVRRSLRGGLDGYRALTATTSGFLEPPIDAVWTSLRFALTATLLAVAIGGAAAVALTRTRRRHTRRWLDALVMLPLGISAVTVGFGFLITFDSPPLELRTSPAIIPIAHALVAIPFVVRLTVPVLDAIDPRQREAAAVLGASPRRVWQEIDLPIATRALVVAAGFAAAISLGEFGATLFIVRPDTTTLPVLIYRLLGRPGEAMFTQAMAASTILMILTAVTVLAIERLRAPESAVF